MGASFNWFDIVLALIIVWSAIAGLRAGFARVVVGFIATIMGLLAAFWCYRLLAIKLMPLVRTPVAANLIGFLIIFIGVMILGALISAVLSRLFRWIGLSWFNHFLGGVAGIFRGAVVIAALAGIAVAFSPSPMPSFLQHSRMLPYAGEVASWLVGLAPRELRDSFLQQMENLKQLWAKPADSHTPIAML